MPNQLKRMATDEEMSICNLLGGVDVVCHNQYNMRIHCEDCVFCWVHRSKGVEYLLDRGYVTKAEALEYMLRSSKQ